MKILKELRKNKKITQARLAEMLGVSRSTISMWEIDESQPDNDTLVKIAGIFDVSTDFLLGQEPKPTPKRKGIKIPVLGRVQAGIPFDAIEEILDWEEISPEMAATGEHFGLRVRGQSMEPRILEGDVIIVRKQEDVDSGDTAIVLVNGYEATVKRIKKSEDGIALIPNNPAFDTIFYSNREIVELPVQILGKVVELRGKNRF
ncbi:LexA family protein [Butyricicoccus porcorum]|uniref:LexA family transcriptional regulator n=1 Tax=Butyricicoccus porcorum TaxID=1945634 RepID=A0A252F2M8_9FIRM|nr:XRE family transcriptional regulator [Butyricicoccus porcorum]OUM20026.1 LexA family transcriptional regulator [Butyricicoccus porcorum]